MNTNDEFDRNNYMKLYNYLYYIGILDILK